MVGREKRIGLPKSCGKVRKIFFLKSGAPFVAQWKQIWLGTMGLRVQSLVSLSGLRIEHCHELWCRSQMRLRPCIAGAVVQADSYSSSSTLSLGTSICCGPKKTYTHTHTHTHTHKYTQMELPPISSLAIPTACGSSQARDRTCTTAATQATEVTMLDS